MAKETQFQFRVYGRHYCHDDIYSITFNKEGWYVAHIAIGGQCNRKGEPFLYENFKQDSISYPANMTSDMEDLWERYDSNELTAEQVQNALYKLGDWVDATGNARPNIWE